LLALTISYSVIPCLLVLVAATIAWRYTLTADSHIAIRTRIDARIAAASGEPGQ
jgi:Na+/melibiose symporter-like transporter